MAQKETRFVFTPGMGDGPLTMQPLVQAVKAEGFPVIEVPTWDMDGAWPFEDRIQQLLFQVGNLRGPCVWVGHSAGALSNLVFAGRVDPEAKPKAVIALSPAMPKGIPTWRNMRLHKNMRPHLSDIVMGRRFTPDADAYGDIALNGIGEDDARRLLNDRRDMSGREAKDLLLPWRQPVLNYSGLTMPVLHMYGTLDRWVKIDAHHQLTDAINHGSPGELTRRPIADVGHMVLYAARAWPEIRDWLLRFDLA